MSARLLWLRTQRRQTETAGAGAVVGRTTVRVGWVKRCIRNVRNGPHARLRTHAATLLHAGAASCAKPRSRRRCGAPEEAADGPGVGTRLGARVDAEGVEPAAVRPRPPRRSRATRVRLTRRERARQESCKADMSRAKTGRTRYATWYPRSNGRRPVHAQAKGRTGCGADRRRRWARRAAVERHVVVEQAVRRPLVAAVRVSGRHGLLGVRCAQCGRGSLARRHRYDWRRSVGACDRVDRA